VERPGFHPAEGRMSWSRLVCNFRPKCRINGEGGA
jgi:hypothetical protein